MTIYIHEVRQTQHVGGFRHGTAITTRARISNRPFDHKMRRWRTFDAISWGRLLANPSRALPRPEDPCLPEAAC